MLSKMGWVRDWRFEKVGRCASIGVWLNVRGQTGHFTLRGLVVYGIAGGVQGGGQSLRI